MQAYQVLRALTGSLGLYAQLAKGNTCPTDAAAAAAAPQSAPRP
jgi:hypothetical protein